MGNCVRKEASTQWGGEDWSSPSPLAAEKQEEKGGFESSGGRREVKVQISKKQLQAVLGKAADVDGGSSVHQLLADLMNAARHYEIETHHRHASWRPSLQTIPEL
ncbi:PREDICTED: uncharacterized protein LOC109178037 [Ipomoea nil]|uniref:uncharacterized protein LOC109178037 n=1 Tax=Ipomoea nil TaxID=35883 RepID=UPI0009012CE4|nr:PREDICTED: uncharacterized protein LOC109178037 [Ipomoea nil]